MWGTHGITLGSFLLPGPVIILSGTGYIGGAAMPMRPKTPCKHPGCGRIVPYGRKYCEEHECLYYHEVKTTKEKGYGRRWQKVSKLFLLKHPLCVRCKADGKLTAATVVDHIKPHRGDQKLFWDESNWQPLCKQCHDKKTMTEDRYEEYRYK